MNTRIFGITLVAALALAALDFASVNAETIEVVGSANGCSSTYGEFFAPDDTPVSKVTVTCPRVPLQVASTQHAR